MASNQEVGVIAVDLDGTLISSDSLYELACGLSRQRPWLVLLMPLWLLHGKAWFKARLAQSATLDVTLLPYNAALLQWLSEQRLKGKKLVLCTASDYVVAQSIADHLGIFNEVIASDGQTNNAGEHKRMALDRRFGSKGYDYVGNSADDLAVWAGADAAVVVHASPSVQARAAAIAQIRKVIERPIMRPRVWMRALRLHQWLKNLLLFVPLAAAHQLADLSLLRLMLLAFIAFGLCASAVYLANDLLDLESDRRHPRKRFRPFASGSLPIQAGAVLIPLLLAASFYISTYVGEVFTVLLLIYFLLTCSYSLWLKRFALVDCLLLAGLYTLRVIAGAAAVSVTLSFWLLTFSVFIFLSLAFVKRYAELCTQMEVGSSRAHGRGYAVSDAPLIQALGIGSGYAAVLVLALYLQGETVTVLYAFPAAIWLAIPLMLFWISWVWLKAHRGQMNDDPMIFAAKDPASLFVAILLAASFILAITGLPT